MSLGSMSRACLERGLEPGVEMEFEDRPDKLVGKLVLGGERRCFDAPRINKRYLVVVGIETDAGD